MRVTVLNQFYLPDISPTAHLAASLAEHRAVLGDDVTVVTSQGGYVNASSKGLHGVAAVNPRVVRIWTPRLGKSRKTFRISDYAAFYIGAALRLLTLPRQDVIVSLTTPPFIIAAALLHKLLHPSTRIVLWNMDCYPEIAERTGIIREGGFLARSLRGLNRLLFKFVDQLVSLDTAMQELLLTNYASSGGRPRAAIVPNWERASFFPPGAKHTPWSELDQLGLRDKFVVLYLGNTGYGHDFSTALEVARELASEPVVFLFVGGGSRWTEIETGAKRMGLNNVIMRGYVSKEVTPAVMGSADCALITLQDFALGVMSPSKLHANLAMSLPVIYIGPAGCNVDDAIVRFDCGISVRHGNTAALVEWIRTMAKSPSRHSDLRDRAREAFDAAYCDTRTLPLFDTLLEASIVR